MPSLNITTNSSGKGPPKSLAKLKIPKLKRQEGGNWISTGEMVFEDSTTFTKEFSSKKYFSAPPLQMCITSK